MEQKNEKKGMPAALGALLAGAVAGLLVLGVLGRLATWLLAAALKAPAVPVTLRGFLEPVLLGLVAGALFALLLPRLHRLFPRQAAARCFVLGALPFAASVAWMLLKRRPGAWPWYAALTLGLVLLLFLFYGWLADRLYARLLAGGRER
ncbi:MAG: hypothetical protein JXO51_11060 [Candidatus Aminicenantes bacterium]|nr:hypothetical protein [Candidatus Aminicenantes bacterium]